jgi:hypothetical protein
VTDPAIEAAQRAWDRVDLEIELERHQPVVRMDDGRIGGCQCMDRVFYLGREDWSTHLADVVEQHALSAAREALAPLRKFHMPYSAGFKGGPVYCTTCRGSQLVPWPCDQARLIYPSEEL